MIGTYPDNPPLPPSLPVYIKQTLCDWKTSSEKRKLSFLCFDTFFKPLSLPTCCLTVSRIQSRKALLIKMTASISFLVALLVCLMWSVSAVPIANPSNNEFRSVGIYPVPVEDFSSTEDDFTLPSSNSANVDDSVNEVPRYDAPEFSKPDLKSEFWSSLAVPIKVLKPSVDVSTASPAAPVDEQQFGQAGSVEVQPDPPVFDRNILLRMKAQGLLKRNQ